MDGAQYLETTSLMLPLFKLHPSQCQEEPETLVRFILGIKLGQIYLLTLLLVILQGALLNLTKLLTHLDSETSLARSKMLTAMV